MSALSLSPSPSILAGGDGRPCMRRTGYTCTF
ncbi:Protein of unknown function [Gryllus bimaculatus]|nr:Protein of unknown function [Gryllus bimaculatus]